MPGVCVKVPQKAYSPPPGAIVSGRIHPHPILFTLPNRSNLSVRDALVADHASMVAGAHDVVFPNNGYSTARLYIAWPGYSSCATTTAINIVTSRGPIRRAQLLMVVAKQVALVLERAGKSPCSSKYAQYRVGVGAVTMQNVHITSLVNTVEDIWQAELEIVI